MVKPYAHNQAARGVIIKASTSLTKIKETLASLAFTDPDVIDILSLDPDHVTQRSDWPQIHAAWQAAIETAKADVINHSVCGTIEQISAQDLQDLLVSGRITLHAPM